MAGESGSTPTSGNGGAEPLNRVTRKRRGRRKPDEPLREGHLLSEEPRPDTLPRIRVRPVGQAVGALRQSLDDNLQDLYDPERTLRQFYKPAENYRYLNFAPTRARNGQWLDPPAPHRIVVPMQEKEKGRWVWRFVEKRFARAKDLYDFCQTSEYRRARFFEQTGDWVPRISEAAYRRYVERDAAEAVAHGLRSQLRELSDTVLAYQRKQEAQQQKADGQRRLTEADFFGTDQSFDATLSPTQAIDRDYYVPIMGGPYYRQQYLYAHWEQTSKAFEMRHHSELAKAAINIVSDFTLGRGVAWKIENTRVAEVWQEFWDRNQMEDYLRTLSDDYTWQGELLVRIFERPTGFVGIRSLDPGSFYEIVTDPQDVRTVLYYAQQMPTQWQMVSWDFRGQKMNVPSSEYVIQQYPPSEMFHLKNNVSATEKWGRSDFFTALTTLKRHRDWVNAATMKDLLQANLVWKIKVQGDQQDVDAFVNDTENATLPAVGGTWVENEALTLEAIHADVASGNRGAQGSTGNFLTALFATSQNMPVSYFNISPGGTARATALTQGEPFIKKIATRQQDIRRLLDHLFEKVMRAAVSAGRLSQDAVRGDDADPEWIFPSAFEEDRGAKFRDLKIARENAAIAHKTMSITMAQDLGYDEYNYDEEQQRIAEERSSDVLGLWPDDTEQAVQLGPSPGGQPPPGQGMMLPGMGGPPGAGGAGLPPELASAMAGATDVAGADRPGEPLPGVTGGGVPPPGGQHRRGATPPLPGPSGRTEELKGAAERAQFKKQFRGREAEEGLLDAADRAFLEAALPHLTPGAAVLLPSGRIARLREDDNCGTGAGGFQAGNTCAKGDGTAAPAAPVERARAAARERFDAIKKAWARVNNHLLSYMDKPDAPDARRAMDQMKGLVKEMYRLDLDPGGARGLKLPGGPRDVVIVGGGPGGLAAGIMAGTEDLDTLVLEAQETPGGQPKFSSRIENYPGFPMGIAGQKLAQRAYEQAQRVGAEVQAGVRVVKMTVDPASGLKTLTLSNGQTVSARAVIIAGGLQFKQMSFPGSDDPDHVIYGNGEMLAERSKDKPVVVVGGSNAAAQAALGCALTASQVYVLSRSPLEKGMSAYQIAALRNHPKIEVIEGDQIGRYDGQKGLLVTEHGRELPASALGVFIGSAPDPSWLPSEITRTPDGKVVVDYENMQTSVPGVFAVGDITRNGAGRIGVAVGQGQLATKSLFPYFEELAARERAASSGAPAPETPAPMMRKAATALDDAIAAAGDNPEAVALLQRARELMTQASHTHR